MSVPTAIVLHLTYEANLHPKECEGASAHYSERESLSRPSGCGSGLSYYMVKIKGGFHKEKHPPMTMLEEADDWLGWDDFTELEVEWIMDMLEEDWGYEDGDGMVDYYPSIILVTICLKCGSESCVCGD